MTDNLEDAIWEDIEKSGLPLELQAASIISVQKGWNVTPNQYYIDLDEGKGRQLDLKAYRHSEVKTTNLTMLITVALLVECKRLPGHVWTFFLSQDRRFHSGTVPVACLFQGGRTSKLDSLVSGAGKQAGMIEGNSLYYHEMVLDKKKSNKQTNNIFESAMSLAKGTYYSLLESEKAMQLTLQDYLDALFPSGKTPVPRMRVNKDLLCDSLHIFQPVVVFDGKLYLASSDPKNLTQAGILRLMFSYRSGKYKIDSLPIDICTIDSLPHYMDLLSRQLKQLELIMTSQVSGKSWLEGYSLEIKEKMKDNGVEWRRELTDKKLGPSF